jgi:hypothetical protein
MDPHQRLSRRGYRVGQLTQPYAADPAQFLRQRYSHESSLLTFPVGIADGRQRRI